VAVWNEITFRLSTNCAVKACKWNGVMLRILRPNTKCFFFFFLWLFHVFVKGSTILTGQVSVSHLHIVTEDTYTLSAVGSRITVTQHVVTILLYVWNNKTLGCYVVIITPVSILQILWCGDLYSGRVLRGFLLSLQARAGLGNKHDFFPRFYNSLFIVIILSYFNRKFMPFWNWDIVIV
jgi:hypothetical protein